MTRVDLTVDAGFPRRLEQAIEATGLPTHKAFAEQHDIPEKNISRYVRGGTPDAEGHRKLAQALGAGVFYWVVTGEHPADWEERTVGSLPAPLRDLMTTAQDLPSDRLLALVTCAKLLHGPAESRVVQLIVLAIQTFAGTLQYGHEVHPDTPLVPDLPPPS